MDLSHFRLKLGGFNNEVAALQSDRCTEAPCTVRIDILCMNTIDDLTTQ